MHQALQIFSKDIICNIKTIFSPLLYDYKLIFLTCASAIQASFELFINQNGLSYVYTV